MKTEIRKTEKKEGEYNKLKHCLPQELLNVEITDNLITLYPRIGTVIMLLHSLQNAISYIIQMAFLLLQPGGFQLSTDKVTHPL